MRELEKPVARVFRRLRYQRFVTTLVWSWAIALFIVAALIAQDHLEFPLARRQGREDRLAAFQMFHS